MEASPVTASNDVFVTGYRYTLFDAGNDEVECISAALFASSFTAAPDKCTSISSDYKGMIGDNVAAQVGTVNYVSIYESLCKLMVARLNQFQFALWYLVLQHEMLGLHMDTWH